LSPAATAVGGYHENGSGVAIRSASNTGAGLITRLGNGTALDIKCQVLSQTVSAAGYGTSAVWDYLNGPVAGWQSDLFVKETPYAHLDPRLPNCNANATAHQWRGVGSDAR
jgi:hypothetical protein